MTERITDGPAISDIPESDIPEAEIRSGRKFSLVWIVPIVAITIGAWLAYKAVSERGPVVTIRFEAATGIEEGKTQIKYKDVQIGKVESIELSDDLSHVVVTAELDKQAEKYVSENTRFWVVRARVAAGEVSGLGTLFSGAYIGIDPGEPGEPARSFAGLEKPPLVTKEALGRHFTLRAGKLGSLDFGSPVYYRQIKAGQVVKYDMLKDGSAVDIQIFISAPYDQYVLKNTQFWNASGIDAVIDSSGVKINTESVVTLLVGGIAFETPVDFGPAEQAAENEIFTLYANYDQTKEPAYNDKQYYLLYFDETIRGLEPGAAVEVRGIKVGEVVDVRLEFYHETLEFKIPVLIALEIERVRESGEKILDSKTVLNRLVEKGLRAQLKTGMFLTGQLYVNLGIYPDAPPKTVDYSGMYPVLPTIPAPMEEMTASLAHFLKRLEEVPVEQIGEEINKTLRDAQNLLASKEIAAAMMELKRSLEQITEFSSSLNSDLTPKLAETLDSVTGSIDQIKLTLKKAESMLDDGSPVASDLQRTLQELSAAARSIRMTADYLERHPDALIYGKGKNQ